jgi:hypothetical protein
MEITFKGRPTQEKLFNTIIQSAEGILPHNVIYSGGAIRGAKSFTNSLALLTLAKMYPNSKWSVHRKDMTILESTTIETIGKIIQGQKNWHWSRKPGNYHLTYKPTESRLLFIGANESRDKGFTDTLGLEINGCFFDQLEDVSMEYRNAVRQRLGSWHILKEPRPIELATFNPHPGWIKKEIYQKYKDGTLPKNHIYFPLSPINEPSNTKSQWEIWSSMPPDVRARMIDGDWNSFDNKNPFFYAYDESKHVGTVQRIEGYPIILAWDFNIDPATCTAWQLAPRSFVHCLKSYKIHNCTVRDLCRRIMSDFPMAVFRVTGDPSGNSRNQGYNSPNETMYSMIRNELNISMMQVDKPEINYAGENYWREMRTFCNTVLQNHPNFILNRDTTEDLRNDLRIATTEEGKDKLYKTSGNTEYGMHLVDTFVYLMLTYFNDYVKRRS